MPKKRPAGDGMVRQKKRGQWEARIVVGHKDDGKPIYRYVYGKTQKLIDQMAEETGVPKVQLMHQMVVFCMERLEIIGVDE